VRDRRHDPRGLDLLRGVIGAAAVGGFIGGLVATPTPDACSALLWAPVGLAVGGIGGTLVGAAAAFVVRPGSQRVAGLVAAFLAGGVCAAAGIHGLMALAAPLSD
jgi:hypothetical protein